MSETTAPQLVRTVAELRCLLAVARQQRQPIGLVPTMGALHEGHLSLVRACKAQGNYTVVSIYVNPSQFGPHEDFRQYPRTLAADLQLLADCQAELVFAPHDSEVYRPSHATWVEVGSVAEPLEGKCRPGHFRGVATIVLKLFHMVAPDVAYFGEKDYQQALVIRRMVEDLDVPVEIRTCPTVREADGLAMSSRNAYLDPQARQEARVLYESLQLAQSLVEQGQRQAAAVAEAMRRLIASKPHAKIDYVALVDPETLQPVGMISGPTLAALAVRIGDTRLIDNCLLGRPPVSAQASAD